MLSIQLIRAHPDSTPHNILGQRVGAKFQIGVSKEKKPPALWPAAKYSSSKYFQHRFYVEPWKPSFFWYKGHIKCHKNSSSISDKGRNSLHALLKPKCSLHLTPFSKIRQDFLAKTLESFKIDVRCYSGTHSKVPLSYSLYVTQIKLHFFASLFLCQLIRRRVLVVRLAMGSLWTCEPSVQCWTRSQSTVVSM